MKLSSSRIQLLVASWPAYYSITTTCLLSPTSAFTIAPPRCPLTTPSLPKPSLHRLHSSSEEDDEEDEPVSDELSRLINKRASISQPSETATTTTNTYDEDADAAARYEDREGMDVFEMPELKFQRPESDDDEEEGASAVKGTEEEGPIDYQADYEDENDLHVPNRIGFDTVAWGDVGLGFKPTKKLKKKEVREGKFVVGDLKKAYKTLMDSGITLSVTSELYGLSTGKPNFTSESILSRASKDYNLQVASAMSSPLQSLRKRRKLRTTRMSVLNAIEASVERLGVDSLDIYQVPSRTLLPPNTLVDALNTALDQGLIQGVGVEGMGKDSMERFGRKLYRRGDGEYAITSNRFEFSLVDRAAFKSGLIGACKAMGVVPIVSNPLGDGLASGVYTAFDPSGGGGSKTEPFGFKTLDKWAALHDGLGKVRDKVKKRIREENSRLNDRRSRYGGASINADITTTQIAINYVVAKGCVPIPSIKNKKEAEELIGCLGWTLTSDEVRMLDTAADMSEQGL